MAVERIVLAGAALAAANETGVLAYLEEGAATVVDVATHLDLDPRVLARTADALEALGVVARDADGQLQVEDGVVEALAVAGRHARLVSALRRRPLATAVDHPDGAASFYPALVRLLGNAFREPAEEVAELLARPGARVLDVGAGAAPWSLAIARREPDTSVVAVDLPDVARVTRRVVDDAGIAERVEVVAGDVLDGALGADLGGPFDIVLLGHVCHLFDDDCNARLLAHLAPHVAADGVLAIIDVLPDGVRDDPALALYALGLSLRTSTGGLHALDTHRRWLAAAGLAPPSLHRTSDGTAVLVSRGRDAVDHAGTNVASADHRDRTRPRELP